MDLIIVDDNTRFRESLQLFLEMNFDHKIIASVPGARQFLDLENVHHADIILMDIEMDDIDGIITTRKILHDMPWIKIVAVTMMVDKIFLEQLIESGFKGCVFKPDVYNLLNKALNYVISGKLFFPDSIKIQNE